MDVHVHISVGSTLLEFTEDFDGARGLVELNRYLIRIATIDFNVDFNFSTAPTANDDGTARFQIQDESPTRRCFKRSGNILSLQGADPKKQGSTSEKRPHDCFHVDRSG